MRNTIKYYLLIATLISLLTTACSTPKSEPTETVDPPAQTGNPAAEGFNAADSDPQAIELADQVMAAMGGRAAWDNTRYISWTFFGKRDLLWDKQTGDVAITIPERGLRLLTNIHTGEGLAWGNESPITEPDSLTQLMKQAKSIWINDAYWLVMPYKLKDSGVTLTYKGEGKTETEQPAHILNLIFEGVGVTPDNRYEVYVDTNTHLVTQWAFYRNAADTVPGFITPWADYQQYGDIMLSGDRGQARLNNIRVTAALSPDPFAVLH